MRVLLLFAWLALGTGCSDAGPAVDPAPFEAAVATYLKENDMAMRLKEVREGPTISGDHATMKASLTHKELGGPSVVWTIEFEKAGENSWRAVSHSD
jgi:hypothetical protein